MKRNENEESGLERQDYKQKRNAPKEVWWVLYMTTWYMCMSADYDNLLISWETVIASLKDFGSRHGYFFMNTDTDSELHNRGRSLDAHYKIAGLSLGPTDLMDPPFVDTRVERVDRSRVWVGEGHPGYRKRLDWSGQTVEVERKQMEAVGVEVNLRTLSMTLQSPGASGASESVVAGTVVPVLDTTSTGSFERPRIVGHHCSRSRAFAELVEDIVWIQATGAKSAAVEQGEEGLDVG